MRSQILLVFIGLIFSSVVMAKDDVRFQFMKAHGTQIVNEQNQPVMFRGISFGNRVWRGDRIPDKHHSEEDFKRVSDMGMNVVRFYMNYKTFESDEQPYKYLDDGWAWIDNNIRWARKHGVYLILNMHVPQGGFQSHGKGWELWTNAEYQNRLVSLWKAIAMRYKDEPVILSYDLLNEPGVPNSKSQWTELAQRLVNEIRKIDQKHPIMVEKVNSVNRSWERDKDMNFIRVKDENIIYTFHNYDPYSYSHQYAPWNKWVKGRDGGVWPNPEKGFDKGFIAKTLDKYLAWGKRNNVPLFFGEWGAYKVTFEKNKGGLQYVNDVLDVLEERQLSNSYHVYHEEAFGLYRGNHELDPKNVNKELKDLFTRYYTQQRVKK